MGRPFDGTPRRGFRGRRFRLILKEKDDEKRNH
jgi:hypothetical protein